MKDTEIAHVGVDVSKASLSIDAGTLFTGEIPNTPAKIRSALGRLVKRIEPGKTLHVCLEATGPYGEAVLEECHRAGIRVSVLNPAKVRLYAKAVSESAKTDLIDARMIRLFAEARKPDPAPPPSKARKTLRELLLAREALSGTLVQFAGTLESVGDEAAKAVEKSAAAIRKQIKILDAAIRRTLKEDEQLCGLSCALAEIEGVGTLTAAKIVAWVPEIGTLGRRRATSLAGLAPFTRQSGTWKGKSFIGGGRSMVRRALFMPATVAKIHNPVLKAVYERLRQNGKPYKVALTAIMRRLFCHMDAVAAAWLAGQNPVTRTTPVTTI